MRINNTKKILFITHQLSRTGAPIVFLDMIKLYTASGYDADVISMLDGPLRDELSDMGINVTIKERIYNDRDNFLKTALGYDIVIANTLVTYEVIHVLNNTRVPVIWWLHEGRQYFEYFKSVIPDFARLGANVHVYAVGHYVRDVVYDIYKTDIPILHFAIDDLRGQYKAAPFSDGRIHFLTAGTYSKVKAQDVLTAAIDLLPPSYRDRAVFSFCGNETTVDDEVFSAVVRANEKHECVQLLHQLSRENTIKEMMRADCLIVPSRIDPIPTVAAEMMMQGGVCLCTNVCGISHYIRDNVNGYTVTPDDAHALCKKIMHIMDSKADFYRIGEAGRKIYEDHFSKAAVEPEMLKIIDDAIKASQHGIKTCLYLHAEGVASPDLALALKKSETIAVDFIEDYVCTAALHDGACHMAIENASHNNAYHTTIENAVRGNTCLATMENAVREKISRSGTPYDYIISFNYIPSASSVCEKYGIVYIAWLLGAYIKDMYSDTLHNQCNRFFVMDSEELAHLKSLGIKHCHLLPPAVNNDRIASINIYADDEARYSRDVSFVDDYGFAFAYMPTPPHDAHAPQDTLTPQNTQVPLGAQVHTVKILNYLANHYNVTLYTGRKWENLAPSVTLHPAVSYTDEMPKVFSLSRINLNITDSHIPCGITPKIMDILGVGGFLMTNRRKDMDAYFTDGVDYVSFEDEKDCRDKIAYYLNHEKERLNIAVNGYMKTCRFHTYEVRLEDMFKVISEWDA